jgi:cytidine deaminase
VTPRPAAEAAAVQTLDPAGLMAAAQQASEQAYAPYSRFAVGAAVLDEQGRVFVGSNVENASYGLAMCAERVAIFSAVVAGARSIHAVAVSARSMKRVAPCGACRQVIAEFAARDARVHLDVGDGSIETHTVDELLPGAFSADQLPDAPLRTYP